MSFAPGHLRRDTCAADTCVDDTYAAVIYFRDFRETTLAPRYLRRRHLRRDPCAEKP